MSYEMESNKNSRLSFFQKFTNQPIFREKFLYTFWICWSFVMLGWTESIFGPTFPDLRLVIGEPLDRATWLFTASSAGFLIGSGITGILYDRYDRLLILIISIVGTAIFTAIVPWCEKLWLMMMIRVIAGMLAASLDTGGNAEVVATWGGEADSYMQALHFCFSLGGMIAPFVAQPFLLESADYNNNTTLTNTSDFDIFTLNSTGTGRQLLKDAGNISQYSVYLNQSTERTLLNSDNNSVKHEDIFCIAPCETKVQYPYLITACCMLLCAIPFSIMYYTQPKEKAKVSTLAEARQPTNFYKRSLPIRLLFLGSLSLLMFVYVGTDDIYAGLLMTFVISHLKWTKSRGSIATSLHWMSFGVARLVCIILVRYAKTYKLMIICGICLVLSYIGLLIATLYDIHTLIWILLCFPGLSMSLLFPAMFTWTNENIVFVSGRISSMYMMSASLGVMSFPPLFGYTMEYHSPVWFLYLLLGQSALWLLLFIAILFLSQHLLTKRVVSLEAEHEPLNIELKDVSQFNSE